MKAYKLLMLAITIAIIVNCIEIESLDQGITGNTQNIDLNREITHFGSFEAVQEPQETTFLKIATEETVIAMNNWNMIKKEFTCILTTTKKGTQPYATVQLTFYEKVKSKLIKKYIYETMASFLCLYPLGEAGGNLLTIWVGGSGYQFVIFSISDDKIRIVFDDGSTRMPEIADIDNDGGDELLITTGAFRTDYRTKEVISLPEARDIYKWNGNTYAKIKSIPWKYELVPLQKR